MTPTLAVDALEVTFAQQGAPITAVREVGFAIAPRECIGVVGESGSGKTQIFMAALGLLPANARARGSVRFEGGELLAAPPGALNRIRGARLSMVFQDPMTALTPHLRVGVQLAEVLVTHAQLSWAAAERAALRMLEAVQVPDPQRRLRQYPHELSGGLRQRVMIGMALLCEPSLLIADEPTTALDVTVQAQIIDLLRRLRRDRGMGMVLISHDLNLVAEFADRILVMYAGRIVENTSARNVFRAARHPYTVALLKCVPQLTEALTARMPSLAGQPPSAAVDAIGCAFAPRCPRAAARCAVERPELHEAAGVPGGGQVACHFPLNA